MSRFLYGSKSLEVIDGETKFIIYEFDNQEDLMLYGVNLEMTSLTGKADADLSPCHGEILVNSSGNNQEIILAAGIMRDTALSASGLGTNPRVTNNQISKVVFIPLPAGEANHCIAMVINESGESRNFILSFVYEKLGKRKEVVA